LDPMTPSLEEPLKFAARLEQLKIKLVNVTAGSPSARATPGNVSSIGWIRASRRSVVRRRKADEIHAGIEEPFSRHVFCRDRVFLSAGISSIRRNRHHATIPHALLTHFFPIGLLCEKHGAAACSKFHFAKELSMTSLRQRMIAMPHAA